LLAPDISAASNETHEGFAGNPCTTPVKEAYIEEEVFYDIVNFCHASRDYCGPGKLLPNKDWLFTYSLQCIFESVPLPADFAYRSKKNTIFKICWCRYNSENTFFFPNLSAKVQAKELPPDRQHIIEKCAERIPQYAADNFHFEILPQHGYSL
jgi:hypothetical protein